MIGITIALVNLIGHGGGTAAESFHVNGGLLLAGFLLGWVGTMSICLMLEPGALLVGLILEEEGALLIGLVLGICFEFI